MNTKAIQGPTGQGNSQDGGLPNSGGNFSNAIGFETTGAPSAGIGNHPSIDASNASSMPTGQGDSATPPVAVEPAPPSGNDVEQFFDIGDGTANDFDPQAATLPEQAYAKPTGPWTGSALGPGMRSGG